MTQQELQSIREILENSDDCSKTVIVNTANALLGEVDRLHEVIQQTAKEDNEYINLLRERCAPKATTG